MNLLSNLMGPDLAEGLKEYEAVPGAILLDVRTPEEYSQGHIKGSRNLPLQEITKAEEILEDKDAPVYLYCQSGARSRRAAGFLEKIGYRDVHNIGGLAGYKGELEK